MNQKCALCGADQVWDQETQKFSCSDQCSKIKVADENSLPKSFKEQYLFLVRTVNKMHLDVCLLKGMNRASFDAYAKNFGVFPEGQDSKKSEIG